MNATRIRLFRSYKPKADDDLEHPCEIWEAIRATSAAPTYFEPISIGPPGMTEEFIDGGVGCNNPISELHAEACKIFDSAREVACILSIGTGTKGPLMLPEPKLIDSVGLHRDTIKHLKRLALTSDREAEAMDEKYRGISNLYFRFNVDQDLARVNLGEWKGLGKIAVLTQDYLQRPRVKEKIELAARAIIGNADRIQEKYHIYCLCE